MEFRLTAHARERAEERGTTEVEIGVVLSGRQQIELKQGRKSKETIFDYNREWLGKHYSQKKVQVIYIEEEEETAVITVKVYYGRWR
ncbi:MAG: DUF4258 domain-containing protein [Dehalococcoidia bacterium]